MNGKEGKNMTDLPESKYHSGRQKQCSGNGSLDHDDKGLLGIDCTTVATPQ